MKGTICNEILKKDDNLSVSVSCTTRKPRPGEIDGVHYSFKTREHTIINPLSEALSGDITGGHGGGDTGIVEILYKYITEDYHGDMLSEIGISVENHAIAFAAEQARVENRVVEMADFEK